MIEYIMMIIIEAHDRDKCMCTTRTMRLISIVLDRTLRLSQSSGELKR